MKQLKKPNINQKGFTLIELLVVVAIIGILAAILIPGLMNKTVEAKVQSSNSNAATVVNSASLAAQQMIVDSQVPAGTAASGETSETVTAIQNELGSQFEGNWYVKFASDGNVEYALWSKGTCGTTQLSKSDCTSNRGTIGCHPLSDDAVQTTTGG